MVLKKAKCAKLRRPMKFNPITASVHEMLIKRKRTLLYMYFLAKNPAARRKGGALIKNVVKTVTEGATLITTLLGKKLHRRGDGGVAKMGEAVVKSCLLQ